MIKCKHKFHFVGFVQEDNVVGRQGSHTYISGTKDSNIAKFICEKCGLLKKIPIKEK